MRSRALFPRSRAFGLLFPIATLLLLAGCGPAETADPTTVDSDSDGFFADEDCDDSNAMINPGAEEICDGLDNDCDNGEPDGGVDEGVTTIYYRDSDGDLFGNGDDTTKACALPSGYSVNDYDCDDSDAAVRPGTPELCNGHDDDCDKQVDEGFDNDGDGYASCSADCNDTNPDIHPGAEELCNGIDDNCDGAPGDATMDEGDNDKDRSLNCADCAPDDASAHPGASEICDGLDNDCDDQIDEGVAASYCADLDGDGFGDAGQITPFCTADAPAGYTQTCTDCNDTNPLIHPGASETCNGLDDNCDGTVPSTELADGDMDGVLACADCNDNDPSVLPGAIDLCDDTVDNDCDGQKGEDETTQQDQEPNDSLPQAIYLGELDDTATTEPCATRQGQLIGTDDEDYYSFYSTDQPVVADWAITATLTVPTGARYCVALIDDDPENPMDLACATGADAYAEVELVPYNATGTYYVRVWADVESTLPNSCRPYTLTACGY